MSRVPSQGWIIAYDIDADNSSGGSREPDLSYPEIKNSAVAIQCQSDGSFPQYYLYLEFFHAVEPCFINLPRYGIPDRALARSFYLKEKYAQRHYCNNGALLDGPHTPRNQWSSPHPKLTIMPLNNEASRVFNDLFRPLLFNYACTKGLRKALVHCPDCKSLKHFKMFITHRECLECVKVVRLVLDHQRLQGDHYHFHCFNCDCIFYVETSGEQIRCNYYGVDSAYQYSEE